MSKALKPLIVVLLLLSIAALTLGVMLYGKREILKGRAQKSEAGFQKIAANLKFEGVNPATLQSYDDMDTAINQIAVAAQNQYDDLQSTKSTLETTRLDLNNTKDELATTQQNLETAKDEIVTLNGTISQKNVQIGELNTKVDEGVAKIGTLETEIGDLNNKITQIEDEKNDIMDKNQTLDQALKECEAASGRTAAQFVPKGTAGRILLVNRDWNFVVLDIGTNNELVPNAEMLVHRDDKFIGKVVISSVTQNRAVADILGDWQQVSLREGDQVVY